MYTLVLVLRVLPHNIDQVLVRLLHTVEVRPEVIQINYHGWVLSLPTLVSPHYQRELVFTKIILIFILYYLAPDGRSVCW